MIKDFRHDDWNKFGDDIKDKKLYIWGAGCRGKEIVEKFASEWPIWGFIDNNMLLNEYMGYTVFHPNDFKGDFNGCCILISTDKPGIIVNQIHEMKVSNYYSYFWLNIKEKDYLLQEDIDIEKIGLVKSLLIDEKSKWTIDQIVKKRKIGFLDYTDIKVDGDEYFDHDFFSYSNDEVFVDGGGFNGDTIEEFVFFTKNNYKKIYSFEPDKKTGELLKSKLFQYGEKVNFYPYGLYSENIVLPFCNDNQVYSSHITAKNDASSFVQCVKLDDVIGNEKVTFIKMDIEGAEIPALYGSKNIITRDNPKLAICIYHKPKDLWEIPLLIHSWVPDYKFYIKHYGARYYGTILFASK